MNIAFQVFSNAFDNLRGARDNETCRLPDAGVTQLVECDLAKVDVAGSNPVSRSIYQTRVQWPSLHRCSSIDARFPSVYHLNVYNLGNWPCQE